MWGDASTLEQVDGSVDRVFASRLFTVLEAGQIFAVISEMHRVLRPGGRCFLAEPRVRWRAAVPLMLLWALTSLSSGEAPRSENYREPRWPTVLTPEQFKTAVSSQPWARIFCWEDGYYQYAVLQKMQAL